MEEDSMESSNITEWKKYKTMIFSDWNQLKADCGGNDTNPLYYDYSSAPEGSHCDRFQNHYIDIFMADQDV